MPKWIICPKTSRGRKRSPETLVRAAEIVRMRDGGLLFKEIAYRFGVSIPTAKSYEDLGRSLDLSAGAGWGS